MDLLWEQSPRSVRDVIDALERRPAYTTIATVMQNLQRKGLVSAQKEGRLVSYVPQVSREGHTAMMMRQAVESSGNPTASILHFVKDMPEEELKMLRQFLHQTTTETDSPS